MGAMGRLVARAASRACCFSVRHIAFALVLLAASWPNSAQAKVDTDQAVDIAVDAVVIGGRFIGVSIPPEAAHIVKDLVSCAVKGKSVPECAKEAVVKAALKNAPEELQQLGACLAGGGDLAKCATESVLQKVPPQARPLAECIIGGGNVASCAGKAAIGEIAARAPESIRPYIQCVAEGGSPTECAARFAINNAPPEAKPLLDCIASGRPVSDCAREFGTEKLDEATQKETERAIEQIKNLKAETEEALDQQKGSVKNIILLAQGIENGEYDKILLGGGPELAKIVLTMVITIIFPPVAPIAGPVIGAIVDLYADLARDIMKMLADGNFGALPEIIVTFYFNEMIARPCALLPEGAFKDAICGNLSKLIAAAAGLVGDAVDFLLGVAESILKSVGLWQVGDAIVGFIGGVIDDIFGDGKEDPKVCGPANAYYVNNYMACLGAAVGASGATSPAAGLNSACVAHFGRCYEKPGDICKALDQAFANQVSQVYGALEEGARAYASAIGGYLYSRRAEFCTYGRNNSIERMKEAVGDFASQCAGALGKNVPLKADKCPVKLASYAPPGASSACVKAVYGSNWEYLAGEICEQYCREVGCAPPPPPCWVWGTEVVVAYNRTYVFPGLERSICVMKKWDLWDRIWPYINPNPLISRYDDRIDTVVKFRRTIIDAILEPARWDPAWGVSRVALNDSLPPSLVAGNCRVARTTYNAVTEWSPAQSSRFTWQAALSPEIKVSPLANQLRLSLMPVAVVSGGFQSCSGIGATALRGSSGSDRSRSPGESVRRSGSGGATAVRSSSGSDMVKGSSAIDRLTGDGLGGGVAPGASGYRIPDGNRPPTGGARGVSAGTGSSGSYLVKPGDTSTPRQPTSSSGASSVQSSGTPVPRQPTSSSGFDMIQSSGTSVPRSGSSSGTLRMAPPRNIDVFRAPAQKPSCDFGNCPR